MYGLNVESIFPCGIKHAIEFTQMTSGTKHWVLAASFLECLTTVLFCF